MSYFGEWIKVSKCLKERETYDDQNKLFCFDNFYIALITVEQFKMQNMPLINEKQGNMYPRNVDAHMLQIYSLLRASDNISVPKISAEQIKQTFYKDQHFTE